MTKKYRVELEERKNISLAENPPPPRPLYNTRENLKNFSENVMFPHNFSFFQFPLVLI